MGAIEKCIIGYTRYISTLPVESKLPEQALSELAALRESGENMAERLRLNRQVSEGGIELVKKSVIFTAIDAAALAEWEAANE